MMGVEAAGQRPERRHDYLRRRRNETAARDLAAAQVNPEFGMEVAGDFGPRLVAQRLVAKNEAAKLDLLGDAPSAMVGEARIVVADDPRPLEARRERRQQRARAGRQPVAPEAVVEAVAEAVEPACAGSLHLGGE